MVATKQITLDGLKDVAIFHHTVTGIGFAQADGLIPLHDELKMDSAAKLLVNLSLEKGLELSVEAVVGRSRCEILKKGIARFPYSPGNLVLRD